MSLLECGSRRILGSLIFYVFLCLNVNKPIIMSTQSKWEICCSYILFHLSCQWITSTGSMWLRRVGHGVAFPYIWSAYSFATPSLHRFLCKVVQAVQNQQLGVSLLIFVMLTIQGRVVNEVQVASTGTNVVRRGAQTNILDMSMSFDLPPRSLSICQSDQVIEFTHEPSLGVTNCSIVGDSEVVGLSVCKGADLNVNVLLDSKLDVEKCPSICHDHLNMAIPSSTTFHPIAASASLSDTPVQMAKVTQCLSKWQHELRGDVDEAYLVAGMKDGFCIVDDMLADPNTYRRNYRSVLGDNKLKAETRINEEIAAGNYIKCGTKPNVITSLGAVVKDGSDIRLIHDLSRPEGGVNRLAWETSVVYPTIDEAVGFISPDSFIAKVDLKSAYRLIPINPACYNLTGLQWRFGNDKSPTYLFDARLPFGASKSCKIFQSITNSICRMMGRRGYKTLAYIDDLICIGSSRESCQLAFDCLIELLEELGLIVNQKKTCGPTRDMVYLGIRIDCVSRTLALPEKKFADLKVLIRSWDKRKKVTKLEVQTMVGKLNWAARVIRGGRTFSRRLIDMLRSVRESHHHVRVTAAARADLSWWRECCSRFHGSCQFKCDAPLASCCFATDSCTWGGGGFLGVDWFYASWTTDFPKMFDEHINVTELFTVVLALRRWGPQLVDCHVRIRSDNSATVAALNKSTSRSDSLMPHIREIFWLCVQYNISISSVHIPGSENVLADRISRMSSLREAYESRLLLANFSSSLIAVKGHVSYATFIDFQDEWIRSSLNFPRKQRDLSDRPLQKRPNVPIEVN
jgi:hypothetical protein